MTQQTVETVRPSLLRLTAVELRKLGDTRAGYWLLIIIGLTAAGIVTVQLIAGAPEEQTFPNFFLPSLIPVAVLLPVLGILSVTSEFSQRTTLNTFALVPQRHRVLAAKLAAGATAALVSVLASLVVGAVGTLIAGATGGAGTWRIPVVMIAQAAVFQMINVVMGVAFGMLLLNSPLAIVLYLLLPTTWSILGGLVAGLRGVAQWLDVGITLAPLTEPQMTAGQWTRLAVSVLVWVVAPMAIGLARILRREVS